MGKGTGDLYIQANIGSVASGTFSIEDCAFYSSDGTKLSGSYLTGSDTSYHYIYNLQNNVQLPSITVPTNFIFSMKYNPDDTGSWGNGLWLVGSNSNNGVLIGAEGTDSRIRIYNWNNGSASSQQTLNNAFSSSSWNTLEIEFNNGVWTSRVGENSVSYTKSFTPSLFKFYASAQKARFAEIKIKAL